MRIALTTLAIAALVPACVVAQAPAQVKTATVLKAPTVTKAPDIGTAAIDLAAIRAFKSGLTATTNPLPSSGPNPLASVTLSWPAYPHATGYHILRAAVAASGQPFAFIPPPGSHDPPTVTSRAIINLPPGSDLTGWNGSVAFRVVAYANGTTDTTNVARASLPSYGVSNDYMSATNNWPPSSAAPFAGVGYRKCMDMGSSVALAWSRNPYATSYTVQLAASQPNGTFTALPPQSVTDTTLSPTLGAGAYRVYVRPEFAVPNWPTSGQTLTVHGAWTFLGTSHTPTPMSVPLPCPHY